MLISNFWAPNTFELELEDIDIDIRDVLKISRKSGHIKETGQGKDFVGFKGYSEDIFGDHSIPWQNSSEKIEKLRTKQEERKKNY